MSAGESSANDCAPRDRIGLRLPGGWVLREVIGRGGSATVYRATRKDGASSAVKIMHPELSGAGDWSKRLRREADLLVSVSHPGLVRLLIAGTLEGSIPFLVMELLDGASLDELSQRAGGTLPPELVIRYASAALEVLAHTHALGVVHRDIKPSNVFVTRDERVKLLDLGIASAESASLTDSARSVTRGILGTPAYMAPEQARGRWELVDARSDVWSVGAMMFRLLAGESVHAAETENERLGLAMTRRARSLASVAPGLDPTLVRVVDRALSYEAERRFQSAGDFRTALSMLSVSHDAIAPAPAADRTIMERDAELETPAPPMNAPRRRITVATWVTGAAILGVTALAATFAARKPGEAGSATSAPPSASALASENLVAAVPRESPRTQAGHGALPERMRVSVAPTEKAPRQSKSQAVVGRRTPTRAASDAVVPKEDSQEMQPTTARRDTMVREAADVLENRGSSELDAPSLAELMERRE